MRILVLSHYFYPEEFRINDLCLELKTRGHTVSVLTGIPNYPKGKWYSGFGPFSFGRQKWRGINIYRYPVIPRYSGKHWQLALNYVSAALSALVFSFFLSRSKYDVIFTFAPSPFTVTIPAVFIRAIKKIPSVLWVQDLWPESLAATNAIQSVWILSIIRKIVRWVYMNTDHIFIQSKSFITSVTDMGISSHKVSYLPNWAESLYEPDTRYEVPSEITSLPAGFRIMFAGNIGEAQSMPTLLEAATLLKNKADIQWLIVGGGRRLEWVREEVIDRGLEDSVILLGRHPIEEMPKYFSGADVMLVILKNERVFSLTIPAKMQSYLAAGKPILASLEGEGARVIEESGAGLISRPEDASQLARAALEMHAMTKSQRHDMGDKALKYSADNFDRTRLINSIENILKTVCERVK